MQISLGSESVTRTVYTSDLDDYGQQRQTVQSTSTVHMFIRPYSQQYVNDPRYLDVELIGLTKEEVCPGDVITYRSENYNVVYITLTDRYTVVLMKKQ